MVSLRKQFFKHTTLAVLVIMFISVVAIDYHYVTKLKQSAQETLRLHVYAILSVAVMDGEQLYVPTILSNPEFNTGDSGLWAVMFDENRKVLWQSLSSPNSFQGARLATEPGLWWFTEQTINKTAYMTTAFKIVWGEESKNVFQILVAEDAEVLESDINEKVQAVCRKYSVTEYHIYLSVFMMLLQKYTPNSRVMMGSTSGIREQQEFRSIIGCLISVLNLSIDIIPTDTFVDLVEKVKNEVILALKHQYVDTDVLSKELNLNQTPKYLVGFTYHFENYIQSVSYENFKVEQLNTSPNDAKVDLWFNIHGSSTSVQIDVEYNNKKYNIQTINKFVERYNHLLDQVLLDSETMIKDYVLTSEIKQLCAREIETFEFGF